MLHPYRKVKCEGNRARILNLGSAATIAILLLVPLCFAPRVLASSSGSSPASRLGVPPDVTQRTLTSPNAQAAGHFGDGVAVDGTTVVVGASGESAKGLSEAGHAYVFGARTGSQLHTLTSPNAQSGGYFGYSVAVSGRLVAVGAPYEAASGLSGAGQVYTFSALTGNLLHTFDSSNAEVGGNFGFRVAMNGNVLVVTARDETVNGIADSGRVYMFNARTGALLHTLTSPSSAGFFGSSVALGGNTVVVGASFETAKGMYGAGHAYTFNANTGALIRTYTSPNPVQSGFFGWSVGVSRNTVVVGANRETVGSEVEAGRAYAFSAATGDLMRTFTSPHATEFVEFGSSVAISGNTVVVGESTGGPVNSGEVYAFNARTGALLQSFTSPNVVDYGHFGVAVSLGGRTMIVGASSETAGGLELAGNAYVYRP